MKDFAAYLANGGTERHELLAQADYMEKCAPRERALDDELGLADELAAEAAELRRRAVLN